MRTASPCPEPKSSGKPLRVDVEQARICLSGRRISEPAAQKDASIRTTLDDEFERGHEKQKCDDCGGPRHCPGNPSLLQDGAASTGQSKERASGRSSEGGKQSARETHLHL